MCFGVPGALGSGGVLLPDEMLGVVRDALGSEGELPPDEFVMCSARRTGH